MAANIGKREQLVGIGVGCIVLIFLLHLIVFGPRATQYGDAYSRLKDQEGKAEEIKVLKRPEQINEVNAESDKVALVYEDALTSLGLEMDPAFLVYADWGTFPFERPADADQNQGDLLHLTAYNAHMKQAVEKQTDLVLAEITRLKNFGSEEDGGRPATTDASFRRAWRLPDALPGDIENQMLDLLLRVSDRKSIIDMIAIERVELRAEHRLSYEADLSRLGMDYNLYRSPTALPAFGAFVPLIHKMAHAQLIERELGDPMLLGNREISREELYTALEINRPSKPYETPDNEPFNINAMFFLHQQLRFLNRLLEIADDNGIAEVAGVVFEEPSYLIDQGNSGLPWPEPDARETPVPTPPPPNPYVLPLLEVNPRADVTSTDEPSGPRGVARGDFDIGYCSSVVLQFRSNNLNGWTFIYEVMRRDRLAEIDEVRIIATDDTAQSGDVWFSVRFLGVAYLFALEEKKPEPPPA